MKFVKMQNGTKIYISELVGTSVIVGNVLPDYHEYYYNNMNLGYYFSAIGTPLHTIFNPSTCNIGDKFYFNDNSYWEVIGYYHYTVDDGVTFKANYNGVYGSDTFSIRSPEIAISESLSNVGASYLCTFNNIDNFGIVMPYFNAYTLGWALGYPTLGTIYTSPTSATAPTSVTWAINKNGALGSAPLIDTWPLVTFFSDVIKGFPGDISETGGGTGEFDTTSDDIDFPSVPTLSAVNAGFITLYTPTLAQLNSLASYLWSSSFDLDTFKKLFADPMDVIIGLSIVPVVVPTSGSKTVQVGFVSTGVTMNLASSQYITVDCGTLTPAEYWGSALDYSPYTKFSIHLPYIGTRELNTDDVMGKAIQVVYNIDILSGACTAMIKCGGSVLYEFSGACATSIPVTGQNWTRLITSCIQLAGAGIAVAATGGSAAGLLPSTANAVSAMKPNIQRTGAVSGSAGILGVQQPYLIWELPRQSLAKNYNKFVGYPSNITALLSTLTGYTQIESVHLENISATQTELAEIETLLKEGVII